MEMGWMVLVKNSGYGVLYVFLIEYYSVVIVR